MYTYSIGSVDYVVKNHHGVTDAHLIVYNLPSISVAFSSRITMYSFSIALVESMAKRGAIVGEKKKLHIIQQVINCFCIQGYQVLLPQQPVEGQI